jgi:polar amino acid transport system substrate-binding protein
MRTVRVLAAILAASLLFTACSGSASPSASTNPAASSSPGAASQASGRPAGVPDAGQSPVLDRMYEHGYIAAGVLAGPPWLIESATGGTDWSGPSWTLAQAVSAALALPLKLVPVGNDTKITSVQTGAIDIAITTLSVTPPRQEVVDFIEYSVDGFCWFALKTNDKVNTLEDLNKPGLITVEVAGGAQIGLIPTKYPNLKIQQVVAALNEVFILEPVLSGKADVGSFDAPLVYQIAKQHPELKFIPEPDSCVANPEFVGKVGWAIQKGDTVLKTFLDGIREPLQPQLDKELADLAKALGN